VKSHGTSVMHSSQIGSQPIYVQIGTGLLFWGHPVWRQERTDEYTGENSNSRLRQTTGETVTA